MKTGEVRTHASRKCKLCLGQGVLVYLVQGQRDMRLCDCAVRRFLDKNQNLVHNPQTGEFFREVPRAHAAP